MLILGHSISCVVLSHLVFNLHFSNRMQFVTWDRLPTPVFLPGESEGWGSLVGCCLWGRTESDMTEVTAAAAAALFIDFIYLITLIERQ